MSYRIRILAGRLDRGAGSHVYHRELACRFAARGHSVSVVCFEAIPEVRDCAEVVEIPCLPYHQSRLLWRFTSLRQYRHMEYQLQQRGLRPVDVVIGGEHLFLKTHWKKARETPWIYLPHSLVVDQEIESYRFPLIMNWVSCQMYKRLQRWALRHSDRTLRFTNQACEALIASYGDSVKSRFVVNPMGIAMPEQVNRMPTGTEIRLLWVGQLIPRKRISLALSCLARLRRYNWRFDIVGDGDLRKELEGQAIGLGLASRVNFHGFQTNPEKWYREADLLLFPSWSENCPVAMLEAMGYGVPCLAMRADGVRFHNANSEIIRDGVDGFLADSDEDFQHVLERLLANPHIVYSAGLAARHTIAVRHSWDGHLERYEQLFDDLLAERARTRCFALRR